MVITRGYSQSLAQAKTIIIANGWSFSCRKKCEGPRPANYPGFPVRALNLPGNFYRGLFQIFSISFVFFRMLKKKIKEEVDYVFVFELFSVGKCKTEQSN